MHYAVKQRLGFGLATEQFDPGVWTDLSVGTATSPPRVLPFSATMFHGIILVRSWSNPDGQFDFNSDEMGGLNGKRR